MKHFLLMILLLGPIQLKADECFEQARSFGGINRIEESCFWSEYQEHAPQNHRRIKVLDFDVWAHTNTLWVQHPKLGLRPIAGENTRLHKIMAVAGSQTQPEVAVLQLNEFQQKEILVFNLHFAGHVKPRRLIDLEKIHNPISLTIDSAREKILVLKDNGQVEEFQLNADDRSVHAINRADWKRVSLKAPQKIIDIVATTDALMALTHDGRLCTYTIARHYLQECQLIEGVQNPLLQMRYYHQERLLEISNHDQGLQFRLD